jgi:hypothetical protein
MSVAQILTYQVQNSELKTFVDNQFHTFWSTTDNNITADSLAPLLTPVTLIASDLASAPILATQTIDTLALGGSISIVCPVTVTNQPFEAVGGLISSDTLLQAPTLKVSTIEGNDNKETINVSNSLDLGTKSLNATQITASTIVSAPTLTASNNLVIDNNVGRSFNVSLPDATLTVSAGFSASGFDVIQLNTVNCGEIKNPTSGNLISVASSINMNNNFINNASSVEATNVSTTYLFDRNVQKGTEGQVLTSGGSDDGVFWKTVETDPSQWSTYQAVSSVDLNNNKIVNGSSIACNNLIPTYRQSYTYYVSPSGDNDLGNGTFEAPYATLTKCLQVTEALTAVDNIARTINLSVGTFTENITISYKVSIFGQGKSLLSSSPSDTTSIVGTVTVSLADTRSSLFQNVVTLDGLLLSGTYINVTSSADSCLTINNCYIYSQNNTSGRAINYNPSSNNTRLRITNTQVTSSGTTGTDPLIEIANGGLCGFNNNQFTAKGVQNVLKLSGTATVSSISSCIFESDSTSGIVPAIVYITTVNSNVSTFSNNAFVYGSSVNKTANTYASGICCESVLGNPICIATYNTFILQGTNSSNYAIQDTGHKMTTLFFSNNASLGNAFAINGVSNVNKFSLTPVV